jgi:glutathione synthase/RimK-type ligase-like ATP-grasp enzyme
MFMTAPKIAVVTARAARNLDEDLPPLDAALTAAEADFRIVDWDDDTIDWSQFAVVVLRSTWDYTSRLHEFLAWASQVDKATRLLNPLEVVRWNTDKHYLGDLARAGVPAVASHFIEPGEECAVLLERFLKLHACAEFVVKPSVGAGSRDAQRYGHEERAQAIAHARRLLDAGRSVLLQPYLDRVDAQGETALVYIDGIFSHAIRKGPLLHRGAGPTRALFAAEHITPRVPGSDELRVAEEALAAIPFDTPLLYTRVDLIRDGADKPCVLELELTEPSLFFAHGADAATRFAAALMKRTNA